MLKDLIQKSRSRRRFDQSYAVSIDDLRDLIELARLTSSARNLQPLRYALINEPAKNEKIFDCLAWAGYLTYWNGPIEGERPTAYIVVTNDTLLTKNFYCDQGLAMQSIMLGAVEKGLGGCIIGSINRPKLQEVLQLDERYEVLYVLALGKPIEEVVLEEVSDENIRYWRDEKGVHHVPKRSLDELILPL